VELGGEFFIEGPPLSQQTRKPGRLREWKEYVRAEAAKLWQAQTPLEMPLKRKGCGAHHKTGQELLRAALRFARA
jgi:hypothetical protein